MNEESRLKAQGRLAVCREIIRSYDEMVEAAPHWLPGAALQSECRQAITLLDRMQERLDRKLIVTIVGPSGAGKSTLLNALAGRDDLSTVGIERPTTKGVTAFCQSKSDADILLQDLGRETVTIRTGGSVAAGLDHVLLVDTPDMDSTESQSYRTALEKTINISDVLFCVLNAENPKRRDTIVFMKPYIDLYPGNQLCVVLNRCDRLQETELKQVILPDLKKHLQASWQRPVEFVFCISARSNLQQPQWPDGEQPLHAYDDYDHLHEYIFGSLNRGSRFVDTRIERAEHLVDVIRKSAEDSIASTGEKLKGVKAEIQDLEKNAILAATEAMKTTGSAMITGIHAIFYQKLAGRWWGPIGWLIGLWTRFLMAGAGVLATMRFGNPVVQIWGLISSLVRYRKTRKAVTEAAAGGDMAPVLLKYRYTFQTVWPDIARKLVELGFNPAVRDVATVIPADRDLTRRLTSSWESTFESVLDRRAGALSGFLLQLFFNLPTLALMGMFAYQSVKSYLFQQTLPSGYFLHAGISILLVWILSFVLLQILVRFAGGTGLLNRAFAILVKEIQAGDEAGGSAVLVQEIDTVLKLRQ